MNYTTLYTGVTSQLFTRIWQHKNGFGSVFTSKYKCKKLVYYEVFDSIEGAIKREKCIKSYSRALKINLIESINPEWKDLNDEIEGMD